VFGFFVGAKARGDDVVASVFLTITPFGTIKLPAVPPILEPINTRVGKEAHVCSIDISAEEKRWPYLKMAIALNSCFFEFISQAPKARLGELAKSKLG
jgi:hypothetical protein